MLEAKQNKMLTCLFDPEFRVITFNRSDIILDVCFATEKSLNKAGEVAFTIVCEKTKAKLTNMHKPNMCCEDLPVLSQEFTGNYSVPKYMEPTTHYLKEICTRRICTCLATM